MEENGCRHDEPRIRSGSARRRGREARDVVARRTRRWQAGRPPQPGGEGGSRRWSSIRRTQHRPGSPRNRWVLPVPTKSRTLRALGDRAGLLGAGPRREEVPAGVGSWTRADGLQQGDQMVTAPGAPRFGHRGRRARPRARSGMAGTRSTFAGAAGAAPRTPPPPVGGQAADRLRTGRRGLQYVGRFPRSGRRRCSCRMDGIQMEIRGAAGGMGKLPASVTGESLFMTVFGEQRRDAAQRPRRLSRSSRSTLKRRRPHPCEGARAISVGIAFQLKARRHEVLQGVGASATPTSLRRARGAWSATVERSRWSGAVAKVCSTPP